VREALDLDDTALEVNATPQRGDCMSVFGLARDYAAAHQGRYLTYGVRPVVAQHSACSDPDRGAGRLSGIRITRHQGCESWRTVSGVAPRAAAQGRPQQHFAIVDVTNYVMIELGQPMHAYDLGLLSGGITVRMAKAGERLMLLDDKEYSLDPEFM